MLQLPEQGLDATGSQVAGRQIEGGLIVQQWMRGGQEALRLFRRFPHLLSQRRQPSNAFQPLAFSWAELAFFFPPLEGGARHDNLLNPGLLPVGEVTDDVLQCGKGKPVSDRALQIGNRSHLLTKDFRPAEGLRDFENVRVARRSPSLTIWQKFNPIWAEWLASPPRLRAWWASNNSPD
jgi:hypothetical protein